MTSATQATAREPRMKNPAAVLPGAWQAIQALQEPLSKIAEKVATAH